MVTILEKWQRPPFLVPAFKAATTKQKFTARRWQQKPMKYHHWVLLLKQVAKRAGLDDGSLNVLSYNSMRRFLPTVASVLRFPSETAQAIGN